MRHIYFLPVTHKLHSPKFRYITYINEVCQYMLHIYETYILFLPGKRLILII